MYLTINKEGRPETHFLEEGASCVLGRGPDCGLVLNSPGVSRHHCRIDLRKGVATLTDLGSHNGTLLNGDRVESAILFENDMITITDLEIHVQGLSIEDAGEAPRAPKATHINEDSTPTPSDSNIMALSVVPQQSAAGASALAVVASSPPVAPSPVPVRIPPVRIVLFILLGLVPLILVLALLGKSGTEKTPPPRVVHLRRLMESSSTVPCWR
ncbi:MAG: FHA domain-containing protein [Planctomycetes bacterium]|nr:FHA domain-containing protein [Planctomycetota bacterium]